MLGTADPSALMADIFAEAFAPRERVDAAEWAERYRVVSGGPTPGAWDFSRAPYVRGILQAYSRPMVRQVSLIKCEQISGTEAVINALLWGIEHLPGPGLFIYPNIDLARKVNSERMLPQMRACPRVAERMGQTRQDQMKLEVHFTDGGFFFFTGSNSDANIESFSYRKVFIDELDRCVDGVVGKVRGRRKTFPDAKLFVTGTPSDEGVGIDAEHSASLKHRWWTPCPNETCGRWHVRDDFRQVGWPRDVSAGPFGGAEMTSGERAAFLDRVERGAWYECPHCGHRIMPHEHRETSRMGVWLAEGFEPAPEGFEPAPTEKGPNGQRAKGPNESVWRGEGEAPDVEAATHVGFHLWGMMSTLVGNPFGEVAREFVQARGRPSREWVNRRLGRAHRAHGARLETAELRRLCTPVAAGGYRLGTCPEGTLVLTAGADIQADRAYVTIRGWGEQGRDTGLVWCDVVALNAEKGDLTPLLDVLKMRFPMAGDAELSLAVGAVGLDSGYWTDDVYTFCAQMRAQGWRNVWPVKGDGGRNIAQPITERTIGEVTKIERHKRSQDKLLVLKVNYWKGAMVSKIRGEESLAEGGEAAGGGGEASRFMLPEDTPAEYLEQITAEERVTELVAGQPVHVFKPRPGYENRNHWMDAEAYCFAVAVRAGVRSVTESAARRITESAARRIRAGSRDEETKRRRDGVKKERPGMLGRAGRGMLDR